MARELVMTLGRIADRRFPNPTVAKLAAAGLILFWALLSFFVVRAAIRWWNIKNPDFAIFRANVKKKGIESLPGNVGKLDEVFRERAELSVSLSPNQGVVLGQPRAGQVVGSSDPDRRQYTLTVSNRSAETFSSVDVRIQLPYPIDEDRPLVRSENAEGVRFEPRGLDTQVRTSGGGSVTFTSSPRTCAWRLRAAKIFPKSRIECIFF